MCEWFALCRNEATIDVPHPILGSVRACERCASLAGVDPARCPRHPAFDRKECPVCEAFWMKHGHEITVSCDDAVANEAIGCAVRQPSELDETRCGVCGEPFRDGQERGEFADQVGDAVLAHAECGLNAEGLELA